ncbi:MAG: MATE family efflux transporter [Eubacterium sp.]|nr:MATE family efflux transporter [Eubacterium sp.]
MEKDLTQGGVTKAMLAFALPMIVGNLFQQFYNIADTLIVGKFLGADALAAVGAAYTLMTFLTAIFLGLCMGSGIFFSMKYGAGEIDLLKSGAFAAFIFIGAIALLINIAVLIFIDPILTLLQIPGSIYDLTRSYMQHIFIGILFVFLYNYFSCFLRAVGNSFVPLVCLAAAAVTNIALDLFFVVVLKLGVSGAADATVIAQALSALMIILYTLFRVPLLRLKRSHLRFRRDTLRQILSYSLLTCVQQSIMNFGILMVQGLVNSFGVAVMAAFSAAVKIDAFAYMPVQDFGNAFSTFIAQNQGAKKPERIRQGIRSAVITAVIFCIFISLAVFIFAPALMHIFVQATETEIIAIGTGYLRIEGACYFGIGCLFLLYGLYRGLGLPGMSVVLTVISLGLRVGLAYLLAPIPQIGVLGIWWAIPIGWFIADITGLVYYRLKRGRLFN